MPGRVSSMCISLVQIIDVFLYKIKNWNKQNFMGEIQESKHFSCSIL